VEKLTGRSRNSISAGSSSALSGSVR